MTGWPAPHRTDPPFRDPERPALEAWLDLHRATLLHKCAGLTPEQLATRSVPPSSLSLLGLVRHLTEVERSWFRRRLDRQAALPYLYCSDGNPDGDFDDVDPARADEDRAAYEREIAAAREVAARYWLDDVGLTQRGEEVDLRWIYLHMIEEYARHNGHADLLRERIDGAVGE
ncbi:MAG: DinB family protein [Kineosporiaceae bacterium]